MLENAVLVTAFWLVVEGFPGVRYKGLVFYCYRESVWKSRMTSQVLFMRTFCILSITLKAERVHLSVLLHFGIG